MMLEKNFTPAADGFHMPGKYEPRVAAASWLLELWRSGGLRSVYGCD